MTPGAVYARRYGRVLLAGPTRKPEVFTAARARGEAGAAPVRWLPWGAFMWTPAVRPAGYVTAEPARGA